LDGQPTLSSARPGPALTDWRSRLGLTPGWALQAVLVAVGYYLSARLGFALTLQPHPISTLWPPNALLLAVLLLAPTRAWWWLLAAALPAHLLAEWQSGVPPAMVLGWYVSNCSEALIGAGLVRAFVPGPFRLDSFRNAGVFLLCAVLAAPLLSSFLDAALVRLIGWGQGDYWELVRTRFLSNVLAELTVGPLILTWAAFDFSRLRRASLARRAEVVALFSLLLVACFVVFDMPGSEENLTPGLYYAPLPFLLWAAMRLGPTGTASALALMTVTIIWGAVHGLGPFTGGAPQEVARDMQIFLTAVAVPLLLLAVALEERGRAQREATEQRKQLAHLSRVAMLGELSGGIAHELNQPLTAILSNAQAAQHFIANKSADQEVLVEILRDIITADQRAGEVIRRLRALFKRGETQFELLEPNDLVREVLGIIHGDLVLRAIEPVTELTEGLERVKGDRVELQQVVLNLVVNACDAMAVIAPEARRLAIRTRVLEKTWVQISVIDSGPGFAAEQYERLFEPFYTTKPQGLGLGLSISRAIIRAHGGRLWGAAERGRGASFHIALPSLAAKR
jgi:signal transduction histidine kinase